MTDKTDNTDLTSELQSNIQTMEMTLRDEKIKLRDAKILSTRLAIGGAVAGGLLVAFGGQWFPGYQLDSTAEATSKEMTATAVSGVMAQLCAERFLKTSGLESRLASLDEASSEWNKASFIRDGKWAAMADGGKADYVTVEKCRDLIAERVPAVAKAS